MQHLFLKLLILFMAFAIVCSCGQYSNRSVSTNGTDTVKETSSSGSVAPEHLIIPGKGIGTVRIGTNADSLDDIWGKPDEAEGAMGSGSRTWNQSDGKITLFFNRQPGTAVDGQVLIRKIRVTSPKFQTVTGLHTRQNFSDYEHSYNLKKNGSYVYGKKNIQVWLTKGMTLEVDSASRRLEAITVHHPQDSVFTDLH